ncbi:MAG: RES family NAD+ phosphorylase [Thiohalorhabdus sp.]|uniref:RES family NAD+ phosphorylase n=1 Tax=Thiohalorhabdus sp. TaxID=3094134 RepID=UPI00397FFCB6
MPVPEPDELAGHARFLGGWVWRVVEGQHYALTRQLVETQANQARLEELLEGSKPAYPAGTEHLDYLLKTPFRYQPPKRGGSRFRRPHAPYGAFYAAEHRRTALAELAFHRYRFFYVSEGTDLPHQEAQLTAFAAGYRTGRALDLTAGELARHRDRWSHPADYTTTQALGDNAAKAGIQAIRYESARDPETDGQGNGAGRNVAILAPAAFQPPHHVGPQTWYLYLGEVEASARRALADPDERFVFPREMFEMPAPAE